jgi:tetratricopeptide (TPR) repeat protein
VLLLALVTTAVLAEDIVVRLAEDGHTQTRSVGEIVDFTGEGLALRHRSGREEKIPPEQVVRFHSAWTTKHMAGDESFDAGRFDEALQAYLQALRTESRDWVRRLILSRCIRCYCRLGRVGRAGDAFLAICGQDPNTPYYDAIPLAWATARPFPGLQQRAEQWFQSSDSEAARLLGASWLLATAARPAAIRTLRELTNTPQPTVAFLAEAQLWRTQIVTATSSEADRWGERIRKMPPAIRGGPLFVHGQLLARHERHQAAALSFLQTAILFPDNTELAAASLLAAAEQLEKLDQRDQAIRLLEEIVTDHPTATVADTARDRWHSLQPPPAER